jgi:hypothetical protein
MTRTGDMATSWLPILSSICISCSLSCPYLTSSSLAQLDDESHLPVSLFHLWWQEREGDRLYMGNERGSYDTMVIL